MSKRDLITYQKNVTSQYGEDGIIKEICKRLGIKAGYFVEVGAADGKQFSNTYSLLSKRWKGICIEGDESKYKDLLKTKGEFPRRLVTICAWIQPEGENTLDNLLSQTPAPVEFDLLSVDIDSYDWQVWRSLQDYSPKIVVIEGNSTVLPGVWQIHEEGVSQGASFTALTDLGESKGYKLVCHTGNLVFVREDLVGNLDINPIHLSSPETLFNYERHEAELRYQRGIP